MHWNKIAQPSVNRNCNPCDCCTLAQSITQFIWNCTVQRCRIANRFIGCNHIQTKKKKKKHLDGVTSQTKSQTIKRMCRMCGRHSKCHMKWARKKSSPNMKWASINLCLMCSTWNHIMITTHGLWHFHFKCTHIEIVFIRKLNFNCLSTTFKWVFNKFLIEFQAANVLLVAFNFIILCCVHKILIFFALFRKQMVLSSD